MLKKIIFGTMHKIKAAALCDFLMWKKLYSFLICSELAISLIPPKALSGSIPNNTNKKTKHTKAYLVLLAPATGIEPITNP
ncbi:MAG: hypothetical protein IJ300_13205 [Clostridia bacterium]|nr:hypothetical protein [Clostridia bacterium]